MGSIEPQFSYCSLSLNPGALEPVSLTNDALDGFVETIWAITKFVYTGDSTIKFVRHVVDSSSKSAIVRNPALSQRWRQYQVDVDASPYVIARSGTPTPAPAEQYKHSQDDDPVIGPYQLMKQAALLITREGETYLTLDEDNFGLMSMQDILFDVTCCQSTIEGRLCFSNTPQNREAIPLIADTVEQVYHAILSDQHSALSSLNLLGPTNLACVMDGVEVPVGKADASLGDILVEQAKLRPGKVAVDAWDGRLTYIELLNLSLRTATHLVARGITVEERLPFCMKKGKWAVVTMYGILFAGATCVPLDIRAPRNRIEALIQRLGARYAICDQHTCSTFDGFGLQIVTCPIESKATSSEDKPLQKVSPDTAAFISFTSGSTGTPKGVVQEHGALYATILEYSKACSYNEKSRVFQFAPYISDASVGDIFSTMIAGGCVCVPSEEQRLDALSETISDFGATHACLTNTVISQLQPENVRSLQYIFAGGEALKRSQLLRWCHRVNFNAIYGTTESLMWDSLTTSDELMTGCNKLGRPMGPCIWVVDFNNPNRLQPIGAAGEILVEGPVLARGYMDDPITTKAKFIDGPAWLKEMRQTDDLRCYRTGDKGCRNADGTVSFLGRTDAQIKIRGQRIEPGEVEHNIRLVEPQLEQISVQALVVPSRRDLETLAAFIKIPNSSCITSEVGPILALNAEDRDMFARIQHRMAESLPRYMVPSLLLPVKDMPLTLNGKLDRNTLRTWFESLSADQVASYFLTASTSSRQPETDQERLLQKLWAEVLKLPEVLIGAEDNFWQLGGDSIKAMELVAALRKSGSALTVAKVSSNPQLNEMAFVLGHSEVENIDEAVLSPFALVPGKTNITECVEEVAHLCQIGSSLVEDIYPATPMQQALMAISAHRSAAYRCQTTLKLPQTIDINKFKSAWEAVVAARPILRTRIVTSSSAGPMQVVLRSNIVWRTRESISLKQYLEDDLNSPMTYGMDLSRYAVVGSDNKYFVWTGHHAVYDGWSESMIFDDVKSHYESGTLSTREPFNRFIHYLGHLPTDEADEFWREQFPAMSEAYPRMPSLDYVPQPQQTKSLSIKLKRTSRSVVTTATVIQAAWALVTAKQAGTEDSLFGLTLAGRDAPVAGITEMMGPTITTVPLRVNIDYTQSVADFLLGVQEQVLRIKKYQYSGLQRIRQLSAEARSAVNFQNLLVIHPDTELSTQTLSDALGLQAIPSEQGESIDYALTLQCSIESSTSMISLLAQYDENVIREQEIDGLLHQLEHLISQFTAGNIDTSLYDIDLMSNYDLERLAGWSKTSPITIDATIHGLIEENVAKQPNAIATSGFDGELTYAELNSRAETLSAYLKSLGVGIESRVVLCFAKSTWPVVAILAVLKSGGVCVSVNPSHPSSRLLEICSDVQTEVLLCDESNTPRFSDHIHHVVAVDSNLFQKLGSTPEQVALPVAPKNAAFIVYTSGSTGKPKGSILEHRSLCTSMVAIGTKTGMNEKTRTLQFSSYTFDAHALEICTTLIFGGCLCVISDDERMDNLTEIINERQVNWSLLTPTVARLLSPSEVPTLQTLILSGEPLTQRDIQRWAASLTLYNGLGPSECSILACLSDPLTVNSDPSNIGFSIGCHLWITDYRRPNRLVPIGCVGELVVEGPIVGRGYVNRPKATAAAFVTDLAWSRNDNNIEPRRFYRSGDLAKLNRDGSVNFVGRADNQIKIRGQRVELGEIENTLKLHAKTFDQVVVEVLTIASRGNTKILAAFVVSHGVSEPQEDDDGRPIMKMRPYLKETFVSCQSLAANALPQYMVPSVFLPIRQLPVSPNGKLERKVLRQWASELDTTDVAQYYLTDSTATQPLTTDNEKALHKLWIQVLKVPENSVGAGQNFFHLGGDSVTAMEMIAAARRLGMSLSVADVFRLPQLKDMAKVMKKAEGHTDQFVIIKPFELLPDDCDLESCIKEAADECQIDRDLIDDIYPCAPMQEALMAVSSYRATAYKDQVIYKLPSSLDLDRFKSSWEALTSMQATLRTRIVSVKDIGSIQVVLNQNIAWLTCPSLKQYLEEDRQSPMTHGSRLCRYAIVGTADDLYFVWTAHHAIYDGWSQPRMFDAVRKIYEHGSVAQTPPYNTLMQYLLNIDTQESDEFWRGQFPDISETYPSLPSADHVVQPLITRSVDMKFNHKPSSNVTMATAVQAAWAIVTARYAGTDTAQFGFTLFGRDVPVAGVTEIIGPCFATVPVRVKINGAETTGQFLKHVQEHTSQIRKYQHAGMQRIRRLSPEAQMAVDFQNLLVIYIISDAKKMDPFAKMGLQAVEHYTKGSLDLALNVDIITRPDFVNARIHYDPDVVADGQVECMLHQFEHVISELLERPETTLMSEMNMTTAYDLKLLAKWNNNMPETVITTVHNLVERQVAKSPTAIATSGFDGELTYAELNSKAEVLAEYLNTELGIGLEDRVILCFTKSTWAIITMLAILKSGGVCVSVNHEDQPSQNLQVCEDVKARVLLCDPSFVSRFSSHMQHVVAVESSLFQRLQQHTGWASHGQHTQQPGFPRPAVHPSNAAFIVYTSGSTGRPKGTVLEHQNIATSLASNCARMGMNSGPETRTLQFSTYTSGNHIIEIFGTLSLGGCVSVISDNERMNKLPQIMTERQVNWAMMAPTAARVLSPKTVPTLRHLLCSGESLARRDIQQWTGSVALYNVWGPSECSMLACTADVNADSDPMRIGRPSGCFLWITDPFNPDRLMSVGCVGEILIEGPILGREYTNLPEATSKVFITNPAWSRNGSGTVRRFYRTGDLAKFNSDGSVNFVGRLDTQARIHGQRVELGQIEHHLRESLPVGSEIVVELIANKNNPNESRLIAFLRLHALIDDVDGVSSEKSKLGTETVNAARQLFISRKLNANKRQILRNTVAEAERSFGNILPRHMMPFAYVPVSFIPTLSSGETDRLCLRHEAQSLTQDAMWTRSIDLEKRGPTDDIQRSLQEIWSRVLKVPVIDVGIDDTFTSLSGDSITAMQVVTECRKIGMKVSVSIILSRKTILAIAPLCTKKTFEAIQEFSAPDQISFELSPIQKKYLDQESQIPKRFNQSCLLRIRRKVSPEEVRRAFDLILERHAMLRARYLCDSNNQWRQVIEPRVMNSYRFCSHIVSDVSTIEGLAQISSGSLDLVNGPVFSVDFFDIVGEDAMMFLTAHHLVVDLVSWRIIWQDLEEVLQGGTLSSPPTLSFRRWCQLQDAKCKAQDSTRSVLPYTTPRSDYEYWKVPEHENTFNDIVSEQFQLSAEVTNLLLNQSNNSLRTVPLDILLALLILSFNETFTERDVPVVFVEHHGRSSWDEDENIDIEQTVGWFTTMYPLHVPVNSSTTAADAVRFVKDRRFTVPGNGRPYFAYRHTSPHGAEAFQRHEPVELLVNFTGIFQQLDMGQNMIQRESRVQIDPADSDPANRRWGLIDVNIDVTNGVMDFKFDMHRNMAHMSRVHDWILTYKSMLVETTTKLVDQKPTCSLSDFPLLSLSYSELDEVIQALAEHGIDDINRVEDIYPCTAMQEGILLSQTKDQGTYQITSVWEFIDSKLPFDQLSTNLRRAWLTLVEKHSALRTGIIESASKQGHFMQVVLTGLHSRFVLADEEVQDVSKVVNSQQPNDDSFWSHLPRLTLYRSRNGSAACRLETSHVLMDAVSLEQLLCSLINITNGGRPDIAAMNFRNFVKYESSLMYAEGIEYWTQYLKDVQPCHLPAQPQPQALASEYAYYEVATDAIQNVGAVCRKMGVTPAALLQTAWATVLGLLTEQNDVCFGYLASGRDAPIDGIESAIGLFLSMQVSRVKLAGTVHEVLHQVQNEIIAGLGHRNCSLASINNALGLKATPLFNSLLTVRRGLDEHEDDVLKKAIKLVDTPERTEFAIALHACVGTSRADLSFSYRKIQISEEYAKNISGTLEAVLQSLISNAEQSIDSLNILSPKDNSLLEQWNAAMPSALTVTVHGLVEEQVKLRPHAIATSGFDGELTYAELNAKAELLATHLVSIGVRLESRVVLCFAKSTWPTVAMFAILKSGGVCVSVNPNDPTSRLLAICEDVNTSVVLTDEVNVTRFASQISHTIAVNSSLFQRLGEQCEPYAAQPRPLAKPGNTSFIVYTSGSTGKPKGIMLEHQSVCTSLQINAQELLIGPETRAIQFSAYTFDVSIYEIFSTLITGGCVCVISDHQRMNDLVQAINDRRADWIMLTPTVARLFGPSSVPDLKTLVFVGEALSRQVLQPWVGHVQLRNHWGPSECSNLGCINTALTASSNPLNIGRPKGCCVWITRQGNPNQLVPIGYTGEMLVEGPNVGRGYLNRPEANEKAFITNPAWASQSAQPRRFYRTGDLARYNDDGSVTFVGRVDTQVKIRGQRVELGEIEFNVMKALAATMELHTSQTDNPVQDIQVVVETVSSNNGASQAVLAFVCPQTQNDATVEEIERIVHELTSNIQEQLAQVMPSYMMPTVYIPLKEVPTLPTGKADRRQLRELGQKSILERRLTLGSQAKDAPRELTKVEQDLRNLWAAILNVDVANIDVQDDFFAIGGDSVAAMRMVRQARQRGLSFTVADIFQHPCLAELANVLDSNYSPVTSEPEHFTSMRIRNVDSFVTTRVIPFLQCKGSKIVNVLPVSSFQKSSIESNLLNPPDNWNFYFLELPSNIDIARLQIACQRLVQHADILRTVFIKSVDEYLQVVFQDLPPQIDVYDTETDAKTFSERLYCEDLASERSLGNSFLRFMIVRSSRGEVRLTIRMSHAQYDGISTEYLVKALTAFYDGREVPHARGYINYIHHIVNHKERGLDYWRSLLEGSRLTVMPWSPIDKDLQTGGLIRIVNDTLPLPGYRGATAATVFTTACALVLAHSTGSEEVVFGRLVSGRAGLHADIQNLIGPCVNIVPVRAHVRDGQTTNLIIQSIQKQYVEATMHETVGIEDIAKQCPQWPAAGCQFPIVTIYQNYDEEPRVDIAGSSRHLSAWSDKPVTPSSESVLVIATPKADRLEVTIFGNTNYHNERALEEVSLRLCDTIKELVSVDGADQDHPQ